MGVAVVIEVVVAEAREEIVVVEVAVMVAAMVVAVVGEIEEASVEIEEVAEEVAVVVVRLKISASSGKASSYVFYFLLFILFSYS